MSTEKFNVASGRLAILRSQTEKASHEVKRTWCRLEEERKNKLLEILKERGLMICGYKDPHRGVGETEEEKLGLFPISSMRLFFEGVSQLESENYSEHEAWALGRSNLRYLCPHHFPENPNRELDRGQYMSEVIKTDDKFIRQIDSMEISISIDIPIEEPEVREEVYEHLGLAPLPDLPDNL